MVKTESRFLYYLGVTISTLIMAAGVYFFKFPNHFSFGGVVGLAILLAKVIPISASTINFAVNMVLLVFGFIFLGKRFGAWTAYSSTLFSLALSVLEELCPMTAPLTDQPLLELCYAVVVPSVCSAYLFHLGTSGGGTDIIAAILKKYTSVDIGNALFFTDLAVVLAAFFIFDIRTGLFALAGLLVKSLVIDNVLESINLCKYFNIICNDPEPICTFIVEKLHHSATVCEAVGAYSHHKKYMVITALRRQQALSLRHFVRAVEPDSFILITNTSEIIGKGFQN